MSAILISATLLAVSSAFVEQNNFNISRTERFDVSNILSDSDCNVGIGIVLALK